MPNYYDILEVSNHSSEPEIKRAYFKLVRRYPPDRYPDDFKKVREAYEILIDKHTRKEYDAVNSLPSSVRLAFQDGHDAYREGDCPRAIEILEYITQSYPNFSVINSVLGDAYMKNSNTGKAIQVYESLTLQEPGNAGFAGKLANAYLERGWHKKAVDKFQKALTLDEDNLALWKGLMQCHLMADNLSLAEQTGNEAIAVSERNNWNSLDIYMDLIHIAMMTADVEALSHHMNKIREVASRYNDNKDNLAWFLKQLSSFFQSRGHLSFAELAITTALELMPENEEIKSAYGDVHKEANIRKKIELLSKDATFPDKYCEMLDHELSNCWDEDCIECRFSEFSYEMDIVYEIAQQRKYVQALKDKYPELYQLKKVFFDRVLDISQTKKLSWEYEKKLNSFARKHAKLLTEDDDKFAFFQEPVRREGEKVGRNDPCPCGSGKKYKKCCG